MESGSTTQTKIIAPELKDSQELTLIGTIFGTQITTQAEKMEGANNINQVRGDSFEKKDKSIENSSMKGKTLDLDRDFEPVQSQPEMHLPLKTLKKKIKVENI